MNSQRDAGLSRYVALGLVPLCAWGLLSALLLHLIAVRSSFIQGGEDRLRMAVLAFAGGVVLLQRLAATQGGEHAQAYKWALIAAMVLFTLHHSVTYRLLVHPGLVFFANGCIFTVLYWVGTRITRACAVDSDDKSAVAAEMGIFGKRARRLRVDEEQLPDARRPKRRALFPGSASKVPSPAPSLSWQEKLAPQHPGRVLFYFSLFAIPAFGIGGLLLDPKLGGAALLGMNVFLYLFCVLALLFLSSYGQLAAYFDHRNVVLPEIIGITWLSLGFVAVVLIVGISFLLPQPPSPAGDFVRGRMVARYDGWKSSAGVREPGLEDGTPGKGSGGKGKAAGGGQKGASKTGGTSGQQQTGGGDAAQSQAEVQASREAGLDKAYIKPEKTGVESAQEGFQKIFDFLLKALGVITIIAGVIVMLVVAMAIWMGISGRAGTLRGLFPKRTRSRKEKTAVKELKKSQTFSNYPDPASVGISSADDLVHYLWEATLARCADAGEPCLPDQTPLEFLRTEPVSLHTIEAEAHTLARWLLHAEYSGEPIPESALPELLNYWRCLSS
ncbi:MAG: DUF4129 domain-containing protein [Candidatus Sumerlaeaceae bacterium]